MDKLHPRIRTALISFNPTSQNPAWHGCPTALGALRGVSCGVANWRPYSEANNIRELALHIAFWENSLANRLSGVAKLAGFKTWKPGWVVRVDVLEEAQWKAEVALLKSIHARAVAALTDYDPDLLDQPAGSNTNRPAIEFIHGAAEHILYHTAQIEMLKTLAKLADVT